MYIIPRSSGSFTEIIRTTSTYGWARVPDDTLANTELSNLKEDYFIQFVDSHNEQGVFLIWCQRCEVVRQPETCASAVMGVVYRPVKKADIPVATFV